MLEEAFPHVSGRFIVLEEPGTRRIVAGLPLCLVKSWVLGNRLICVPFAAWCDPLVTSADQLAVLLGAASEIENKTAAKFSELRVRRTAEFAQACGLTRTRRWLHHYVELDRPRQDLWRSLSRTAVRRLVQVAEKAGVAVTREDSAEALGSFHQMLSRSRREKGLPQIPLQFFRAMQLNLAGDGQALLLARWQGQPCGGVLATKCRATFHLDYAGAASEQVPPGTMQLLYWRALELAQDEGCGEFSFGRTDCLQSGLVAYKRHWGCREEELCEFRTNAEPAADLDRRNHSTTRIVRMLIRRLPRPVYQLAGDFIYRHR